MSAQPLMNSPDMFDSDTSEDDVTPEDDVTSEDDIRKENQQQLNKVPLTDLSPDQINCLDPFR